jgi:lysophospholipase L1-like esterase
MNIAGPPFVVTVVHMGDSITYGQYVDPELRWTTLIADRLIQRFADTPVHIQCLNRGISGETTRNGLERFPRDLQEHRPDVVTLQFGLNDCNCWLTDGGAPRVSAAAYRANLLEMVDRARRFGARHVILANNHPTLRHKVMLDNRRYEESNARYSEILESVANETATRFCDIRKSFQLRTAGPLDELLLPYPDQLHLSVKGNALYADTIWPVIKDCVEAVVVSNTQAKGIASEE